MKAPAHPLRCILFLAATLLLARPTLGAPPQVAGDRAEATLVSVRKIWDAAPHNAFTDLIRFRDQGLCVFREGQDHVSPDGALRVIRSRDGATWESAALIQSQHSDLRDAKICLTPEGELMLSGAEALHDRSQHTHQSLAWFSRDGEHWSEPVKIGDPDYWLWRTTWHDGTAYAIGYGCRKDNQNLRLYLSKDGRKFDTLVTTMHDQGYPNETSIVFHKSGVAWCLVRRDAPGANGLLAIARPPYTQWEWKDLGQRLGGPHMIQIPDGRLVAAVRLYDTRVRTGLCWIDPDQGTMREFLTLPSGGDNSYPGLVWHEGHLWISYYSSHEGKSSIYLAKVEISGL
jgi:hypothetical protein